MNVRKRLFILLPVVAVLLAVLTTTAFAAPEQATALTLDTETTVQITEGGTSAWLSFVPTADGAYILESHADRDTVATVYDANMEELAYNDDGSTDNNFSLCCTLEKGKTYYYEVRFYYDETTGQIPVKLILSPIKSISNATATVMEYASGDWYYYYDEAADKEVAYFSYWYNDYANYTVTFTDNSTQQVSGSEFEYQGITYYLSSDDQQGESEVWEGGNTYTGTISAGGVSCDIAVTVEDLPIKRIQLDPISMIANSNGWYDTYWDSEKEEDVEYFRYDFSELLTGTATFADDSTAPIHGNFFEYGDWSVVLNYIHYQGGAEIWTVGNTYNVTVTLGELSQTVPVTITGSPVKKMEVQPITLYGDVDGHIRTEEVYVDNEWVWKKYTAYDWSEQAIITVTFTDDTTYTTQPGERYVKYEGTEYEIDFGDTQDYDNQWKPGNTYTETVKVLGAEAQVSITIGDNLIKSIQAGDVTVTEGIDGYMSNGYYYYEWPYAMDSLTVTFADDTVFTGTMEDFSDTYGSYVDWDDDQSSETPWTAGNTYDATLRVGILEVPVKVTVVPSPIQSVAFEPVIMAQDAEEEYYWIDQLLYTVTFRDGTTVRGDPSGFTYQGADFWLDWRDEQEEAPWGTGTHTGTVEIMGKLYEVPVYIGAAKTSGKYSYVVYNKKAYLCDSRTGYTTLTLPTELGGYTVAGLIQLGQDLETVKTLTLPNSYTHLSPSAFWHDEYDGILEKLTVGTGVKFFSAYGMYGTELKEVTVKSGNANFCSSDGVVYNKAKTRLVFYPWNKSDSHTIPNTVTDIEALVNERTGIADLDVTLGTGTKDRYVQEGDYVFTKDKKTLVFCNSTVTGSYTLPTSVTGLGIGAFSNTGFTSVTLHNGITYLPQSAFYNCTALTKVTLPDELDGIPYYAFVNCTALKSIQIPQGVCYIDYGAFMSSGLTTVVIPDTVEYIYPYAFQGNPLTDVYYSGDEADWDKIDINHGNDSLLEADIHFDGEMVAGDLDGDFRKTTDDAVYLLLHVMFGAKDYPVPAGVNLDFNGDSKLDTNDAVYLLLHVMFGEKDYPI